MEEKVISKIFFTLKEDDEIINTNEKILFKLIFESINKNSYLQQFTLSADEQLKIFENNFQNDDKKVINLYLSLINQVLLEENHKFDLVLNIFYKIYNENKYKNFQN